MKIFWQGNSPSLADLFLEALAVSHVEALYLTTPESLTSKQALLFVSK